MKCNGEKDAYVQNLFLVLSWRDYVLPSLSSINLHYLPLFLSKLSWKISWLLYSIARTWSFSSSFPKLPFTYWRWLTNEAPVEVIDMELKYKLPITRTGNSLQRLVSHCPQLGADWWYCPVCILNHLPHVRILDSDVAYYTSEFSRWIASNAL